jgi:hypothetical protein
MLLLVVHWKLLAAIFLLRLLVGAVLAMHAWRHLGTLWAFRLVFFTEMRAPQYWLEPVR